MRIPITTAGEAFWLGKNPAAYNFAMMARVRGAFTLTELRAALARVCERHPLAAMRLVVEPDESAWLVSDGVPEVPVRVLESCGEDDWQAAVEWELGEPFDPAAGPFIRLALLRGAGFSDLILVFNHCAGDGMSGAYLTRDLLRLLGEPETPLATLPPYSGDIAGLAPDAVKEAVLSRLQLWAIARCIPAAWVVQKMRLWAARRAKRLPPARRFCLLAWRLSQAQTAALVACCRAERTTVHAVVCAAWLRADAEIEAGAVAGGPRKPRWLRKVSSPVNLRARLAGPVGETFGLFMSNTTSAINLPPGRDLWDAARALKETTHRDICGSGPFLWLLRTNAALCGLSKADRRGAIDLLSSLPPDYDLAITNLGRLDFPVQVGPLHVEALYGPLVNGFPLERTVSLLTFGGRLHFAFAFRDFLLDRTTAGRIRDRAMEIIEEEI